MTTLPTTTAAAKLTGTPIGTAGSYENNGNTIAKVFDGLLTTGFDAPTISGAWVGLDLGATFNISRIDYAPRSDWVAFNKRMVGGRVEVCAVADFSSGVTVLATIAAAPLSKVLTTAAVSGTGRYVRYVGPDGGYCNIAELAVYGVPAAVVAPLATVATAHVAYPAGWTTPPAAAHTYYVDGTNGTDSNAGTDPARPFKTAGAAQKLAKDGDAIRFAYGSVNDKFSGYFAIANGYVGPYGDATKPQPIINVTGGGVALRASKPGALIQFLDIRGDRTSCTGIKIDGNGSRVEGCSVTGCFQAIAMNGTDSNVVYRCNLSHNYSTGGGEGQAGLYSDRVTNLLVDSCVLNANGWDSVNPATSSMFNHGHYGDDDHTPLEPIAVHNCIIAGNAAWGVEGRPGGVADDNLFLDNGINGGGIFLGGAAPEACNNVFTGAVDKPCPTVKRGTGLGVFSPSGNFHDNLFVNSAGPVGPAIQFGQVVSNKLDVTVGTPMLANNLISGWDGYGLHFDVGRKSVSLAGNRIAVTGGNPAVDVHVPPGSVVAVGNTYAVGSTVRYVTGQTAPIAQWSPANFSAVPGDGLGTVPTVTATVEGYAASVGLPASGQALLAAAEANCGPGWSDACSAHAVNSYFREAARQ